jgi:hypothetical protein
MDELEARRAPPAAGVDDERNVTLFYTGVMHVQRGSQDRASRAGRKMG